MKLLQNLFKPSEKILNLIKELEQSREKSDDFLRDFDPMVDPYCTIRQTACISCGLLYWEKDIKYRYIKANAEHCKTFYGIDCENMGSLLGKTDLELMEEYRKKSTHTYGDLCYSTDQYVIANPGKHRFFEFGSKDDKPLVLDVTKETLIDKNGMIIGTKGFAINLACKKRDAYELLDVFIKKNIAWRLDAGTTKEIAAYYINDPCDLFDMSSALYGNCDISS